MKFFVFCFTSPGSTAGSYTEDEPYNLDCATLGAGFRVRRGQSAAFSNFTNPLFMAAGHLYTSTQTSFALSRSYYKAIKFSVIWSCLGF